MGSLGPELMALLAAQEDYERRRKVWTQHAGRHLCDLSYANPQEGPTPQVIGAIRDALDSPRELDLQYTPYGGATITRRLVAQEIARTHDAPYRWRDIVMTPGAMAALNIAFRSLKGDTGVDEVIVPTPCWMDYPLYLMQLGLRPVLVPLDRSALRLDLDRIANALGPSTRAVVISQPANPSGVLYSAGELGTLAALLHDAGERLGTQPWIISDECHRDFVFGDTPFVSPLALYDRTLVVYSFGKALFMQGQRIGYLAVPPRLPDRDALATIYERLCRAMGFCTPTSLMQLAVRKLLSVERDLASVAARRARMTEALEAFGYDVPDSQATFFLYPRSPIGDDVAFAESLASEGVLVLPARLFHDAGRFRIALTVSDAMIDRALTVFERAAARSEALR